MDLKDLNKENTLGVAQYVVENDILDKPKFDWWAHDIMKQSEHIIDKANQNVKHYSWLGIKYGIRAQWKFEDDQSLDEDNGNNLWWKTIYKGRYKVNIYMKYMNPGDRYQPGYTKINGHWICDIKLELTRK